MSRTVFAPESCLQYLEENAKNESFLIGLILGQKVEARENVIHLARTPEEKISDSGSETSSYVEKDNVRSLTEVSESWVTDHAKHVTRMLPGGMFVQGIFIINDDDIFDDPNQFSKVRAIVNYMHKSLNVNQYMHGNCPDSSEKLILHMSIGTKLLTCKSIEVGVNNKLMMKPVELKFLPKAQQWQRLDCYFEFDDVYPVIVKKSGISVKQQFQQILETAQKTIESSVMFIDGELKSDNDVLEQLNKKKKVKVNTKLVQTQEAPKSMQVSLFVPYVNSLPETVEYLECDGSIHFSGVVSSSVFMYPKSTVKETMNAVKQDIIRSLASRFTMHCDALIDDNLLPEEKVCFNEPPRRVLVPVGSLYLCDYLFPGEAPAEALLSVKELLDLQITETDVVCDVETPADTSEFDALDRDASNEELLATPQEASQLVYITGICFAMFVLLVSIVIHYYESIVRVITKLLSKNN